MAEESFGVLAHVVPRRLADGVVTRVLSGTQLTFVYVELEPGVPVAEHAHDNEQIGVLLAGSIAFRIGGDLRVQRAGETWVIPPGVRHGIDETGPEGAVMVEAFAPARPEYAELEPLPVRPLARPFPQEAAKEQRST
jgi:quercetin dioxygenase-like cupin family protein